MSYGRTGMIFLGIIIIIALYIGINTLIGIKVWKLRQKRSANVLDE